MYLGSASAWLRFAVAGVGPMMDWTDEVYFFLDISDLGDPVVTRHLHVTSVQK
jgi:hypothetical protein